VAEIGGGGLLTGGKREKLGHIDRQEEEEDKGDIDGMSGGSHVKEIDYLQKMPRCCLNSHTGLLVIAKNASFLPSGSSSLPKITYWLVIGCLCSYKSC
jgi:hypothetical protein